MFDLKTLHLVLSEFEEKGLSRDIMIDAIETALATAYRKQYGKRGQEVRARLDMNTGTASFEQVKKVVDDTLVRFEEGDEEALLEEVAAEGEVLPLFDSEKHMLLEDAKRIKRDAQLNEEIIFPLEPQDDFGRIAAQTARQVVFQKIREAEKRSIAQEFGNKKETVVSGIVQRVERGSLFIDLGRATGIIPYEEQIPGERYRGGERVRAYLSTVDEGFRGVFLRLSRANPQFVVKLFEIEVPELANKVIEVKAIAREPGSRTKIAIASNDPHVDPVGSLVGQRGVRVNTVTSELGGERIDIIEWSADPKEFIKEALQPASVLEIDLDETEHRAIVTVTSDQQSLAIGRGGQNVRLANRLTGWSIDIRAVGGEVINEEGGESKDEEMLSPKESAEIITEETPSDAPVVVETETARTDEGEVVADAQESRDA